MRDDCYQTQWVHGMNSMHATNGPDVVLSEQNIILKQKNNKL